MCRFGMLFLLILFSPARAESYDWILERMTPGSSITIIGESHRRIESPEFIRNLVGAALEHDQSGSKLLANFGSV